MRIGKNAYGLQYHIEVDRAIIESWIKKYFKVSEAENSDKGRAMLKQFDQLQTQFFEQAECIYGNFGRIVEEFALTKFSEKKFKR